MTKPQRTSVGWLLSTTSLLALALGCARPPAAAAPEQAGGPGTTSNATAAPVATSTRPLSPCEKGDFLDCARAAVAVGDRFGGKPHLQLVRAYAAAGRLEEIELSPEGETDVMDLIAAATGFVDRGDADAIRKMVLRAHEVLRAEKDMVDARRRLLESELVRTEGMADHSSVLNRHVPPNGQPLDERAREAVRQARQLFQEGKRQQAIDLLEAVNGLSGHTGRSRLVIGRELVAAAVLGDAVFGNTGLGDAGQDDGGQVVVPGLGTDATDLAQIAEAAATEKKAKLAQRVLALAEEKAKGRFQTSRLRSSLTTALLAVNGKDAARAYVGTIQGDDRLGPAALIACKTGSSAVGDVALDRMEASGGSFDRVRGLREMASEAFFSGCAAHARSYLERLDVALKERPRRDSATRDAPGLWALLGEADRAVALHRMREPDLRWLKEAVIDPLLVGRRYLDALRVSAKLEGREDFAHALATIALAAGSHGHQATPEENAVLRELMDETLGLARTLKATRELFPKAYIQLDDEEVFYPEMAPYDQRKVGPRVAVYIESARFCAAYRPKPTTSTLFEPTLVQARKQNLEELRKACDHNNATCLILDDTWSGTTADLVTLLGNKTVERLKGLAKR